VVSKVVDPARALHYTRFFGTGTTTVVIMTLIMMLSYMDTTHMP
jgi:hypothetical protein